MEAVKIQLQKRETTGKGHARKSRQAGRIPGILYGHKQDPLMFDLDEHKFEHTVYQSPYGRNQLFAVEGLGRDVEVLIKDLQVHPVSRKMLHVDFLEIRDGDRVLVEVPVQPKGRAAGQSAGGTLQLIKRTVKIICPPKNIPSSIVVDVTPLQVAEDVTIGDLPLPEGAEAVGESRLVVITIKPPRVSGKKQDEDGDEKKKK